MAENRKYYYLKVKDSFFDSDEMIVMESMPDGYKYSNILLKLYLRSLKNEGRLMFNANIPFNSVMLAQITRHSVGDIEKAIQIFRQLGLIEVLDNGAIYMMDIQNFIGQSSTEGDRKRLYRNKVEQEKSEILLLSQKGQLSGQMTGQTSMEKIENADLPTFKEYEGQLSDKRPPEKEIEKEIELEKDINIVQSGKTADLDESDFEELWKLYPRKEKKQVAKQAYLNAISDGVTKQEVADGIQAFLNEISEKQLEQQFIPIGGNFFRDHRWEDDYSSSDTNVLRNEKTDNYKDLGW